MPQPPSPRQTRRRPFFGGPSCHPAGVLPTIYGFRTRRRLSQGHVGMLADPAELMFYQEMSTERFFDEADRLGISLDELRDERTHDWVFYCCLVALRAETAEAVANRLGMSITAEQAQNIARNSLVPEIATGPAPLSAEERRLAEELYFHAIKAASARHGETIADDVARAEALRMVVTGERGLTRVQRFSRACGCLVLLGMILSAGSTLAAGLVALVVW